MNPTQLLQEIIEPALIKGDLYTPEAASLLLATAAVESNCGKYIRQIKGPALGIFQMEPRTHSDIWDNYLSSSNRSNLADRAENLAVPAFTYRENLVVNPVYACYMARLLYLRSPLLLPVSPFDIDGAWYIYKTAYNSILGATTYETFVRKWEKFVRSTVEKHYGDL